MTSLVKYGFVFVVGCAVGWVALGYRIGSMMKENPQQMIDMVHKVQRSEAVKQINQQIDDDSDGEYGSVNQ